ncbi:MAG: hypothetical protein L0215_11620 [Gemmataceae bacterium]|nr:hypothetical protein [Gemmataceae bacterium]
MSISFKCPACRTVLKVGNEVPAGTKIKCPKCSAVTVAPVAEKAVRRPDFDSEEEPVRPKRSRVRGDESDGRPSRSLSFWRRHGLLVGFGGAALIAGIVVIVILMSRPPGDEKGGAAVGKLQTTTLKGPEYSPTREAELAAERQRGRDKLAQEEKKALRELANLPDRAKHPQCVGSFFAPPGVLPGDFTFSPDGSLLAIRNRSNINLVNLRTGKHLRTLTGHSQSVNGAAFSPDNLWLVSAGGDKSLRIWEVNTGETKDTITANGGVWDPVFSPDGKLLVYKTESRSERGGEHDVRILNFSSREMRAVIKGLHTKLLFSPNGLFLCTESDMTLSPEMSVTLALWDPNNGTRVRELKLPGIMWSRAFSPDGWRLAIVCQLIKDPAVKSRLFIWDLAKDERTVSDFKDGLDWVAFSPDGKWLACNFSKETTLRDSHTGKVLHTSDIVGRFVFSPGGEIVFVLDREGCHIFPTTALGGTKEK